MKKAAVFVIALAAGWLAGTFLPIPGVIDDPSPRQSDARTRPPAVPLAATPSATVLLPTSTFASVPDVRQSTNYTCGAAALQAVLSYWGTDEREDRLAARLHSTPEAGTHPQDILRVAREFGLSAELGEGLDLADLERALAAGTTVIVDLQAWREPSAVPWTETWDDGHYMVLLGMDAGNMYFEDPSLLGVRGMIPRTEFVDRWHDYEGEAPLDATGRKYTHMAIFIKGGRPAPARQAPFAQVR